NLGWQSVVGSGWLRWREKLTSQQQQEEEEILTGFESRADSDADSEKPMQGKTTVNSPSRSSPMPSDPQLVGWEFKIVRANRDLFRDPDVLEKLCQEEATAGWILLEKLDNRRVRFKRLIALRNILDAEQLSYDPYRSHYGSSFTPLTFLGAIAAITVIVIPSYFAYTFVSKIITQSTKNPPVAPSVYEQIPPQTFPPTEK
ncbi:MAG TPA: hypothetical protein V6D14_23775, partial [Coleofasciculaceae cyanobacterium]